MSQNQGNGQNVQASHVNVEQLRKAGYKVRVCHTRDFWPLSDVDGESIMTRREYEDLLADGEIYCNISIFGARPNSYAYGDNVRPTGGFTLVEVTTPNGETLKGKFNFNANRQYDKREGVKIALLRAFKGNLPDLSNYW